MPHSREHDQPRRVIDGVNDTVVPYANTPIPAPNELLASCRSRIFLKTKNLLVHPDLGSVGKSADFFFNASGDFDSVLQALAFFSFSQKSL